MIVEKYEYPLVKNVVFYAVRAEQGHVALSVNCMATGPVILPDKLPGSASVFPDMSSPLFDRFSISRVVDPDKSALVYVLTDVYRNRYASKDGVCTIPLVHPGPG